MRHRGRSVNWISSTRMTADILGDFHVDKKEVDESCSPMIAEPEEGEVEEFLECHKLGLSPGSSQVILRFHLPVLGLFLIGLSL